MAEIIDPLDNDQPQDFNQEPEDNQDNLDNELPESNIPEKYRGKTLDEIVKMHQEAEKLIGRQAQEVGEVRKLADDLIKQQIGTIKPQPETSTQEVDFFEDPNKAINSVVENNPAIIALKQQAEQQRQQQALANLASKHPDYLDVVNQEDFGNWIKSSKVRTQLFMNAQNYDTEAADELLSTYKALKGVEQQKSQAKATDLVNTDKEQRKQTIKAASVQAGGSGETSQKIFRRSDILRLMMTDKARYNDLEPEIRQAYAEGRVRG